MISLSTKLRTVDRISVWTSVRSAVCARRVIATPPGLRCPFVTGEYGPRARIAPGVLGHGGYRRGGEDPAARARRRRAAGGLLGRRILILLVGHPSLLGGRDVGRARGRAGRGVP